MFLYIKSDKPEGASVPEIESVTTATMEALFYLCSHLKTISPLQRGPVIGSWKKRRLWSTFWEMRFYLFLKQEQDRDILFSEDFVKENKNYKRIQKNLKCVDCLGNKQASVWIS